VNASTAPLRTSRAASKAARTPPRLVEPRSVRNPKRVKISFWMSPSRESEIIAKMPLPRM